MAVISTTTWLNLTCTRQGERTCAPFNSNKKSWSGPSGKAGRRSRSCGLGKRSRTRGQKDSKEHQARGIPWRPCHIQSHRVTHYQEKWRRIARLAPFTDWAWQRKWRQTFQVIPSKGEIVAWAFRRMSSLGGGKRLAWQLVSVFLPNSFKTGSPEISLKRCSYWFVRTDCSTI